jgi:hypothetical protein
MSQSALLRAVKARLQNVLEMTDKECNIMYGGQPPPAAGQRYVAIHEGGWKFDPQDVDYGTSETFGVKVTVTWRVAHAPLDKIGSDIIQKAVTGMEPMLREINAALHQNYADVMNEANDLIEDPNDKFVEPLWAYGPDGPTQIKGAGWFYAEPGEESEQVGVARTLVFDGAKRIQAIATMT